MTAEVHAWALLCLRKPRPAAFRKEFRIQKSKFSWGYLIAGIVFIVMGFLALFNTAASIEAIAYLFGIMAIISGVLMLVARAGAWGIVGGVLAIIAGIFILFNIFWTITALPYIFAVWFIASSVYSLITISSTRRYGTGYMVFSIIINILGILLGVALLFNPFAAYFTISWILGIYFMLAGIECIIYAFAGRMGAETSSDADLLYK